MTHDYFLRYIHAVARGSSRASIVPADRNQSGRDYLSVRGNELILAWRERADEGTCDAHLGGAYFDHARCRAQEPERYHEFAHWDEDFEAYWTPVELWGAEAIVFLDDHLQTHYQHDPELLIPSHDV